MNTHVEKRLTDWIRLLVMLILLVMALFTIPMHAPEYTKSISVTQPVHKQLVPVNQEIIGSRSQISF